ncbi:acetylcholinesterase-1-like [Rhipicephalus microplus]|uniref:acetylcholinesterase-1-like n=1 Tax=Rhipicephalus microplus TaxID=6941 RepID=UPI003F6C9BAF
MIEKYLQGLHHHEDGYSHGYLKLDDELELFERSLAAVNESYAKRRRKDDDRESQEEPQNELEPSDLPAAPVYDYKHVPLLSNWRLPALLSVCLLIGLAVFLVVKIISNSYTGAPNGCLVASTDHGYALGRLLQFEIKDKSYSSVAFYGIPFGDPPTRERRFAEPRCAKPRVCGLFNATYPRTSCTQTDTHLSREYIISAANTTEDCLHINVWVPGSCVRPLLSPENRRAIVFWLYGGSFVSGGNSYDFNDGRFLAGLGDVLVVMPNYRLSSFGFLNSGTDRGIVGNMALYDQLLALRWVRDNVHRFGGDSDRILIGGQSAGAITSSMYMISPMMSQYGPYQRAFLMSGSLYTPLPKNKGQDARNTFINVATKAGCELASVDDTARCLRNRSAAEILDATKGVGLYLMPVIQEPLFPSDVKSLQRRFLKARARDTLISSAATEGRAFFELLMPSFVGTQKNITADTLKEVFPYLFGNVKIRLINLVISFLGSLYDLNAPNYRGWIDLIGDTMSRCPVAAFANDIAATGKKVYYMQYTPRPSFSPFSGKKATHGDEVPMLFGYPYLYPYLATDEDRAMSYRMMTMVSNFAKNGSLPKLVDGESWPLFNKSSNYQFVDHTNAGFTSGGPVPDCPLQSIFQMLISSGQLGRRAVDGAWAPEVVELALEMLATLPTRALEVAASAHAGGTLTIANKNDV